MSEIQKTVILFDHVGTLSNSDHWGPLINELKQQKYRVGVCTGGKEFWREDKDHITSQGIDLEKDIVLMNASKGWKDYYSKCLTKQLNVNVQDIVLIDDGQSDSTATNETDNDHVQAAVKAGARGIHVNRESPDIAEVRQRLVAFGLLP